MYESLDKNWNYKTFGLIVRAYYKRVNHKFFKQCCNSLKQEREGRACDLHTYVYTHTQRESVCGEWVKELRKHI